MPARSRGRPGCVIDAEGACTPAGSEGAASLGAGDAVGDAPSSGTALSGYLTVRVAGGLCLTRPNAACAQRARPLPGADAAYVVIRASYCSRASRAASATSAACTVTVIVGDPDERPSIVTLACCGTASA